MESNTSEKPLLEPFRFPDFYPKLPQEMQAIHSTFDVIEKSKDIKFCDLFKRVKDISLNHGAAQAIAFSPDGRKLAIGHNDKFIHVSDIPTDGKLIQINHGEAIKILAYTLDGKYIIGGSDKKLSFWSTENNELDFTIQACEFISSADVSQDGKSIAIGNSTGTVEVWNYLERKLEFTSQKHQKTINSLRFSKDSRYLITGSDDTSIIIWDLVKHQKETSIKFPTKVTCVIFTPDVKYFIVGALPCATLHTRKTYEEIFRFTGHTQYVNCLAFINSQKYLITASLDMIIKVWSFAERFVLFSLAGHSNEIKSLAAHPSSYIIASSDIGGNVKIWDFTQTKENYSFRAFNKSEVMCVCFSPDNKLLAACSNHKSPKVWYVETKLLKTSFKFKPNRIWSMLFTHDGKTLIAGGDDKKIIMINVETSKFDDNFYTFNSMILSLAITATSDLLICSFEDGMINIFDINTKSVIEQYQGHSSRVSGIAINSGCDLIASAGEDSLVKLWSFPELRQINTFQGHTEGVKSVCFTQDSERIISCSNDKSIRVWHIKNMIEEFSLLGHHDNITSVALSKNSKYFMSTSLDKTIKVWNLIEKHEEFTLRSHEAYVYTAAFSSDGKLLASGSEDGIVKLWDMTELNKTESHTQAISITDERFQHFWHYYNVIHSISLKHYSNISIENCKIFITAYLFTTLHLLAYRGETEKIRAMINANKIVFYADSFGHSPLYYSIQRKNQNTTDLLLEYLNSLADHRDSVAFVSGFSAVKNDIQDIIENSSKHLDTFLSLSIYCKYKTISFGVPIAQVPLYKPSLSDFPDLNLFVDESQLEGKLPLIISTVPFRFPTANGSPQSISFLKVIKCSNLSIYKNKCIQIFIQYKWESLYNWIISYTLLLWINLVFLLLFIKYKNIYFISGFAGVNLFLLIWELIQWSQTGIEYISDGWNILDLTRVVLTYTWIALTYFETEFYLYYISWIVILLSIIRGLTGFRAFDTTRFYIRLILQSLMGIRSFLLIFMYTTLSFGLMHIAVSNFNESEITFETLWMDSFGLALGYSENMKSSHFDLKYVTFLTAIVINLILMLNLIISLLGDSFDQFQLMAEVYNYTEMIQVVLEIEQIKSLSSPDDQYEYLHTCEHAYQNQETWKGKVIDAHESIKALEKKMNEVIKMNTNYLEITLQNNFRNEMAEMNERIELKMDSILSALANISK